MHIIIDKPEMLHWEQDLASNRKVPGLNLEHLPSKTVALANFIAYKGDELPEGEIYVLKDRYTGQTGFRKVKSKDNPELDALANNNALLDDMLTDVLNDFGNFISSEITHLLTEYQLACRKGYGFTDPDSDIDVTAAAVEAEGDEWKARVENIETEAERILKNAQDEFSKYQAS